MADQSMMWDFWKRTAEMVSGRSDFLFVLPLAAGLILLLVLVVSVSVVYRRREEGKEKTAAVSLWRYGLPFLSGMLWALPVLSVLTFFIWQAVSASHQQAQRARAQREAGLDADSPGLRFVSHEEPPLWVRSPEKKYPVIWARGPNRRGAEEILAARVRRLLENRFPEFQWLAPLPLEVESVQRHLVVRQSVRRGEEVVREYHNEAVEVFWAIDLSPSKAALIHEEMLWPRLWTVGSGVLLLTVIVFAATAYLRLDVSTGGQFRGRLKLASVFLVIAVGTVLSVLQKPV